MVKRFFFISFIITVLFNQFVFAQQITARASVNSSKYSVGDYIDYTISINYGKNLRVFKPALKDSLKGIEIVRDGQITSKDNGNGTFAVIKYTLSKYDSGDVQIPQIPVYYSAGSDTTKKIVLTNPVSFSVRTLKVNQSADIKDVKDPISIPLDWKMILLWVLGILIILGLITWGILNFRKKKAAKKGIVKIIERKPHEIALSALNELEAKKLWQKGYIKQYHTEITEIIRRYFESRFFIPALEMTTSDLMNKLSQVKGADGILNITSAFLSNADMVKFAKYIPMDMVNDEMMKQAYDIVNTTIPRLEAEESAGRIGNVQ